jgi:hypothetical protein
MRTAALVALLASAALPSHAAQIEVNQSNVTIDGDIELNDFETFRSKTAFLNKAVVILKSDGGKLLPAIWIGELVRARRFVTYVQDRCESACGLIWLAGSLRFRTSTSLIGFHSSYDGRTGNALSLGNDVAGAYLAGLGLSSQAIEFVMSVDPADMIYMTPNDAKRLGIELTITDPPAVTNKPRTAAKDAGLVADKCQNYPRYVWICPSGR